MLIPQRFSEGIRDGSTTVAFRRWRRPQVVAGRPYRTTAGRIAVVTVDEVDEAHLTEADAAPAGYPSRAALVADLRGDPTLPLYRIRFRALGGPDPRDQLAASASLTDADVVELDRRLDRLDRTSTHGPWTADVLTCIAAHPRRRAADLPARAGRELRAFKADVRKLKALGLTISLDVGYELSPRGVAYLRRTARGPGRQSRP